MQVNAGQTFWGQEWQTNLTMQHESMLGISQEVPKDMGGAQLWKEAQESGVGARNFIESRKLDCEVRSGRSYQQ